jgi:hypothetical protein
MDIYPEGETSYTAQSEEVFPNYVENESCAKQRDVPVNKFESVPSSNLVTSATASGYYQASFQPHDSSSDDQEYFMLNNVAETTPRHRNGAAR